LLIASGPSSHHHSSAIIDYIYHAQPTVICVNLHSSIPPELTNYNVACNPSRLLVDLSNVSRSLKLITPLSMLNQMLLPTLHQHHIIDYGVRVVPNTFTYSTTYCEIPSFLTFAYILSFLSASRVSELSLAGFDGYPLGDRRNDTINSMLQLYEASPGSLSLTSLTPTIFNCIEQRSVYSFLP